MKLDTKGGHDEGTRLNECTKRGDIENKKMIRDNENEVIYIRKARQKLINGSKTSRKRDDTSNEYWRKKYIEKKTRKVVNFRT